MEINKDRLCKELKKLRDYYKGNPKKDFIKSDYPKFVVLNKYFAHLQDLNFLKITYFITLKK